VPLLNVATGKEELKSNEFRDNAEGYIKLKL
jgi:hypothetical protein